MPLTYTPGVLGPVTDPLTAPSGGGAQTLIPTALVPTGAGLDLTALLAAPIRTTLQFSNTGREVLFVLPAAPSETVTVEIGATIAGQPVTPFPPVTMTAGHLCVFGPFSTVLDTPGTSTVTIVLSTTTSVQAALVQSLEA